MSKQTENLNASDVKQHFIQMVEDRIKSLERDMSYSKQGQEYYDKLSERIDELHDLLGEMKAEV